MEKVTPMMKQFLELKEQYKDCILLFRAGDFYETFYEDAKEASSILNITLTKRGGVPMAGVPFHSVMPYIKKLIENNKKVAICEQLEDPKKAKGLVKRGITRIITPGTILEEEYFSSPHNNFIMCIYIPKNISEKFGVSFVDISTGEFFTTQTSSFDDLKTLIKKYSPKEIILNESKYIRGVRNYVERLGIYYTFLSDIRFNINYANEILKKQFKRTPSQLGLDLKDFCVISCGALLFYIYKLQKLDLSHINRIKYLNLVENMIIDEISLRNLDIIENVYSKDNLATLIGIINKTTTSSGFRLLRKHLVSPLLDVKKIEKRLDGVSELNELVLERDELRDILKEFGDIERISSRISSKIVTPKDLVSLRFSLEQIPKLKEILRVFSSEIFVNIRKIESFEFIVSLIKNAIVDEAPSHTRDIGYIKKEYNKTLCDLYEVAYNSKGFLAELEDEERIRTKIPNLKIKYNKIFGYYIEVPKTHVNKIPEDYEVKQTLVNAIRYTKKELKEKEDLILGSEEKIKFLEQEIFDEIVDKLKNYVRSFQKVSKKIALLDVLISHSLCSQIYNYVRPEFSENESFIEEGRNPIVERFVSSYVPNDSFFNESESFKIITGPNMSGKSTYLRQVALISILAQIGSFVPAKRAKLKIYDRVFTRIGAHDELAEGQSTFMVEMRESANILNNAKSSSLVLLDEIGRGTSTYDGLAIAWSICEYLANKKIDTIFATHYHQLNKLSEYFENVVNYNVLVKEEGENIEFLRKIVKGGTDKSYGIYVAKLAGIPKDVVDRAKEIQESLEREGKVYIRNLKNKNKKKDVSVKKLDDFFKN